MKKDFKVKNIGNWKFFRSKDYNYNFNKVTGYFERYGATKEEDPVWSPYGIELIDIEIVDGECLGKCKFCYKQNNSKKTNNYMSFDNFKKIFHKFPETITQIAFGITNIYANPDFFKIMEYSKQNGVIPNYTMHGLDLDDYAAQKTVELCGAVAVSIVNKEKSYNAIEKLTNLGMKQVNCHFMLSEETFDNALSTIKDIVTDPRLKKLNAIVFLQYKDKNPKAKFHSLLDIKKYRKLIDTCDLYGISYGFDSCSASIYNKAISNKQEKEKLMSYVDSCESGRMSFYINKDCIGFPCSFSEGTNEWEDGINILEIDDFQKEVWNSYKVKEWRESLLLTIKDGCANCPIYNLDSN